MTLVGVHDLPSSPEAPQLPTDRCWRPAPERADRTSRSQKTSNRTSRRTRRLRQVDFFRAKARELLAPLRCTTISVTVKFRAVTTYHFYRRPEPRRDFSH